MERKQDFASEEEAIQRQADECAESGRLGTFQIYVRHSPGYDKQLVVWPTYSSVNHRNGFSGPPVKPQRLPPSLSYAHGCWNHLLSQREGVFLKVKEVPVSGFFQTWPWPGHQELPVRAVRAQRQPAGSLHKLFKAWQMGHWPVWTTCELWQHMRTAGEYCMDAKCKSKSRRNGS